MKKRKRDRKKEVSEADQVPTQDDWGVRSPHVEWELAFEKFGGKSIDEMMPFVRQSMVGAFFYFPKMPAVPFGYYIQVFERFLNPEKLHAEKDGDVSEATLYFLFMIENDLERGGQRVLPIMSRLMPLVEAIGEQPEKYHFTDDVDPSVPEAPTAASIKEQCAKIQRTYIQLANGMSD